jgi:hypothetical protein
VGPKLNIERGQNRVSKGAKPGCQNHDRAEKASVLITTNLPFSEWTKVFTNARLCKALLDRLTDRAHIIETGSESYRFRRTLERRNNGIEVSEASRNASGGKD